ncbi:MAG: serine/threonine-protein phosphatase [Candidatus Latescibacteria bacterium]|jgi:serine phosphatase RsbU (regulator of sigma subunit)|nr:serine/threonine-protein phosphatase [Candidatus Latescibacterota bacterium]
MSTTDREDTLKRLTDELANFQGILEGISPLSLEIPQLEGLDIFGKIMPMNGIAGGDHIIYVDFKQQYNLQARIAEAQGGGRHEVAANLKRCRNRAGVILMDVSGHQATDALLAAMLHQSFRMGALYELDIFGQITNRLFENLNTRFYNTSSMSKYFTMIYGEIATDTTFRFFTAGHPPPIVFSDKHGRFMDIDPQLCAAFPPIGMQPSKDMIDQSATSSVLGFKSKYVINKWEIMGENDIMIICSDGLLEHSRGGETYYPKSLQDLICEVKNESAATICDAIQKDALSFNNQSDDISFIVIKRI